MEIRYPEYYDTFRCIAAACPDSCCKEWAVQIDDRSTELYAGIPGALGEALRAAMAQEDGDTILTLRPDGRCPMWRDDGLCRIQAELGEEALCDTCRQFPRLRHDYGDFVELGLELSCPEAARLILNTPHTSTVCRHAEGSEPPAYDTADMEILLRTREDAYRLIDDTTRPPQQMPSPPRFPQSLPMRLCLPRKTHRKFPLSRSQKKPQP